MISGNFVVYQQQLHTASQNFVINQDKHCRDVNEFRDSISEFAYVVEKNLAKKSSKIHSFERVFALIRGSNFLSLFC